MKKQQNPMALLGMPVVLWIPAKVFKTRHLHLEQDNVQAICLTSKTELNSLDYVLIIVCKSD